jgi:phosphoribosylamine-glycine ligase
MLEARFKHQSGPTSSAPQAMVAPQPATRLSMSILAVMDFGKLIAFGKEQAIDLVVIGPDNPLAEGIVDSMEAAGLRVFGPSKKPGQIRVEQSLRQRSAQTN